MRRRTVNVAVKSRIRGPHTCLPWLLKNCLWLRENDSKIRDRDNYSRMKMRKWKIIWPEILESWLLEYMRGSSFQSHHRESHIISHRVLDDSKECSRQSCFPWKRWLCSHSTLTFLSQRICSTSKTITLLFETPAEEIRSDKTSDRQSITQLTSHLTRYSRSHESKLPVFSTLFLCQGLSSPAEHATQIPLSILFIVCGLLCKQNHCQDYCSVKKLWHKNEKQQERRGSLFRLRLFFFRIIVCIIILAHRSSRRLTKKRTLSEWLTNWKNWRRRRVLQSRPSLSTSLSSGWL